MDAVARFLGQVRDRGDATDNFRAMFGALELKADGWLQEEDFIGRTFANLALLPIGKIITVTQGGLQ